MSKNYEEYELDDFIADEFFIRWVKYGEPEADYFWEKWLSSHPQKRETVAQAKAFVQSIGYEHRAEPTDLEFLEVLENIHRKGASGARWGASSKNWWRYAAAIGFFLGVSWVAYWLEWGKVNPQLASGTKQEQGPIWFERSNPAGQKSNLLLPDGTRIKLNAESSIRLEQGLAGKVREVYLTGEAFFEVAHDSTRPFVIHTGEVSTTVLGTAFNVRAYPEEDLVVAVESGKVAVGENGQSPVLLDAEDMLKINLDNKDILIKRDADITAELAWRSGVLVYKNARLSEIVRDIERWYGIEVELRSGLDVNGRYDGHFDNKNLENVLQGLCYLSNMHYQIEGKKVVLSKK